MRHKLILPLLVLLGAGCAHSTAPDGPVARRYTALTSDNRAGTQVVTPGADALTVDFEYNDRGRGPKTTSVIRLDEHGIPASIETTGVDYFKVPVSERFSVAGGVARWTNGADDGQASVTDPRFYLSVYGPPEEQALLAKALIHAPGQKLPLLPAGEASVLRAGSMDVGGQTVTQYTITGLDFTPVDVWLDADENLFASVSSYFSVIREGQEASARQLIEVQEQRAGDRLAQFAAVLSTKPAAIVVTNARLFDPVTGRLTPHSTIVVRGNRIVSVGNATSFPEDAEFIDAQNRVVLPGLWDMHSHLTDSDGLLDIAAGVTSARDLGNDIDTIAALKRRFDDGTLIGPRVVLAGIIDGPGPYKAPTNVLVSTEEEARAAIDRYASLGYEQIKIYSSVKPELVAPMANYAHERGLRVSGHIPAGMLASQAIAAGYDEIQHANMLMLNFMPDVTDTRTPARFTAVAERGAALSLTSPEVRAFIAGLRARNIVIDPTLAVFESMLVARAGKVSPGFAPIYDRLPPQVRRTALTGGLPVPEGKDATYIASFKKMTELVKTLHDNGVRIVAGTDGLAGFTLHRELELYVQAGIPAPEVLRIATLFPAQLTKREADLGTIAPGKLADFILVDGDPTQNISDLRNVVTVVKDGRIYQSRDIYAMLGVR
ncbi:MAG TPA: amidohydrolase family protein [Thermoanaerobaculia bacterium]|jgi:imidazolonepropionase-like amidohydrolase